MNLDNFKFHSVIPALHTKGSQEKFFDAYARVKLVSEEDNRTLVVMVQVANKQAKRWKDVDLSKDAKIMKNMPHTLLRTYKEGKVPFESVYKLKDNKNDEIEWNDEFWEKLEEKLKSIAYLEKIKEEIEKNLDENQLTGNDEYSKKVKEERDKKFKGKIKQKKKSDKEEKEKDLQE